VNLLERIDHWAAVSPKAIAHVSDGRTLTYGELRRRADALAAHLAERLGADRAPIAALGHREPEMVIAFLGAVKSGRPYVPLDTALPKQRIDKILATSRAALMLTPEDIPQFPHRTPPLPRSVCTATTHSTSFLQVAAPVSPRASSLRSPVSSISLHA